MTDANTPRWQLLSGVARIARDIDEQFANAREQYRAHLKARDRPHDLLKMNTRGTDSGADKGTHARQPR